jgi:fructose-specific phosphotransferase system IIA component
MNLLDILNPSCIKIPLESTDKKGVIDELVDVLAAHDMVSKPDVLKDAVWTREQTRTTGIGRGLAIPHSKSDSVSRLVIAIGKPAEPMEFASIDNKPVQLIVLLASPPERTSDHIQALAQISRLMTMDDFRERAYGAESGEELFELWQAQELASQASSG